jgi:hypothetical protein
VSWASGDLFTTDGSWNGLTIVINSVNYTISSVSSGTSLNLTSSAGTQSGVTDSVNGGGYGVQTNYISNLNLRGTRWLGNPNGTTNFTLASTGGNYIVNPPTGSTSLLGTHECWGTDCGYLFQNNQSAGQAWSVDSLSTGNLSIFPLTNTNANLFLGGRPIGSNIPIVSSLTTTALTHDNVSMAGVTSSSHCQLTATNSSAATNVATTYVSAKTTNQITVTHTSTSGMTYDIACTPN